MLTELETDQSGASPFRFRGIIEGFYGRPWAWTERHSTLDFMAREGLNTYLYAPKNEPLHRNRWREPYLPEDWARFARLHEHGARLGIDVVFGLSPLEFHYGDPDDLRVLLEKLHAARAVGYRSFCLLLDDMPDTLRHEDDRRRFGALADAQAWLLRRLLPDVPGDLWFVPTEYHGTGTSAYLTRLGEASPPRVRMFWTGPQTVSRTIGASDLTGVNAALRRRVVLWDNYPVNDLDMRFRLHLGPYEGRAADLARACDGVLAAGGLQPHAHRIPLATFAAFLRAPDAYDPDAQWTRALEAVTGSEAGARAVGLLADLARQGHLGSGGALHNHLYPALDAFWNARGGPPPGAGPELPGRPPHDRTASGDAPLDLVLTRLEHAAQVLLHLPDDALRRELLPWSRKLGGLVTLARRAVEVARTPGDTAAREALVHDLDVVREEFAWVAGDVLDQFARRCVWYAHGQARAALDVESAGDDAPTLPLAAV